MLKIKTLRKYFWKITLIAIFIFFTAPSAVSASTIFRAPSVDGLVGYWNFDIGAGGSTVYDMSGNANHGTMVTMDPATDWVDGKVGSGALDFDGTNDYVDAGNGASLDITEALTISAWINPTVSGSSNYRAIVLKRDVTNSNYQLYLNNEAGANQGRLAFYNNTATVTTYVPTVGVWTHIVATVNGTALNIYANGVSVYSGVTTALPSSTGNVTIGRYPGDPDGQFYFNGLIDEVRVYNRALSAEEIQRLYKTTAGTKIKPSLSNGLVGYWNFDIGAGGSTVYDMSGNANHGTLTLMDPATDWVDGKVGSGALDFDGTNDYVDSGDINTIDGISTFTFSAWVKLNSISSLDGIFSKVGTLAVTDMDLLTYPVSGGLTGLAGVVRNNSGETYGYTTSTLSINVWYHVVMVFDGNGATNLDKLKIYIDGVNQNLTFYNNNPLPTLTPSSSGTFKLGRYDSYSLDGLIDEVRVYNRALSAEEIQRLYKTTAGTKISKLPFLSKGLVGYWDLNDGVGSAVAKDKSGQGHNGTLTLMDPATDWVDGKIGSGALDFDGSNDYINIVNNSLFENMISNANVNKTLAVWFNADTLVAESVVHLHPSLMNKGNVYMNFGVDNSGELAFMWYNVSAVTERLLTSGAGISTGSWYHGAVVLNQGTVTLYVNGVNKGSGTFTGIHTGGAGGLEWFGTTGGTQGTQRWDGKIDEARIYNRALSAEEIQRLYDLGNLKP